MATILLTDLVGSTRLANSVGPVRADELREEHFELLRDAIATGGGREVKNTGDGLMVAFASPSGAVLCAVAMQQGFERRYRVLLRSASLPSRLVGRPEQASLDRGTGASKAPTT